MVPLPYFSTISGSPERLKKHISSSTVLSRLVDVGLLKVLDHPDVGPCVRVEDHARLGQTQLKPTGFRSRMIAEEILLGGLRDWVRHTGLGSSNSVRVRHLSAPPAFGQFTWDLSAPSYLYPMLDYSKKSLRHGFIVADVLLGRHISPEDLQYFRLKAGIMRSLRNTRRFLAIFIGEHFTNEALRLGRRDGLVIATTETLFGRDVAEGLSQLIQVLNNAAAAVSSDPNLISQLFTKLDAVKGAALNLRGPLFELLLAHCLRTDGWSILSIGEQRKDPGSGELAEIDLLANKGPDLRVCECKGYSRKEVSEQEAKNWLEKSVPRIRNSLLIEKFYQTKNIVFELWTTGAFSPEAEKYLRFKRDEIGIFRFEWFDGSQLRGFAEQLKLQYALKLLREQYGID